MESRSAAESPGSPQIVVRTDQTHLKLPDSATESLGTQFIEGLVVDVTRTTMTIPAGQIGNDRPIQVVSERWFSPDLQVLVMSRQSDPRYGETTYRLTNIVRGEPAFMLFEVPQDFKVIDLVHRPSSESSRCSSAVSAPLAPRRPALTLALA